MCRVEEENLTSNDIIITIAADTVQGRRCRFTCPPPPSCLVKGRSIPASISSSP